MSESLAALPGARHPGRSRQRAVAARERFLARELADLVSAPHLVRVMARCEPWGAAVRAIDVARVVVAGVAPLVRFVCRTDGQLEHLAVPVDYGLRS